MNALVAALMLAAPPAVVIPPLPSTPEEVSLEDLKRFPPRFVASANSGFSWRHKQWLNARSESWLTIEERDYWQMRRQDQHWRWDVWSDLAAIHSDVSIGDTAAALGTLTRLRKKLGDDAYWRGDMPPCCAVWLFQRSD